MRKNLLFVNFKTFSFCLITNIISACSHLPPPPLSHSTPDEPPIVLAPVVEHVDVGTRSNLISADEIFELTPDQQKPFFNYLKAQRAQGVASHRIVTDYLKQFINSFNYYSETLIARDSLAQHRGNCLSLAILTTAYARLAGVDVGYQLMDIRPVYMQKGNTIFTAQHVRSILYDPDYVTEDKFILLMKPLIVIDYFPTNRSSVKAMVSENEFISMYFRNKAADAIAKTQYKNAFWLAKESLEYAPNNLQAINMLAIIYDKMDHTQDADNLYQFAIAQTSEELELLSNYHEFLEKNNRLAEAVKIKKLIDKIDQPNPFDWLQIADTELSDGHLMKALKYYDKVVDLAPYLHHGYAGRAKVEFLRGNNNRARLEFKKAEELSVDEETSLLMRAKLSALNQYREHHSE